MKAQFINSISIPSPHADGTDPIATNERFKSLPLSHRTAIFIAVFFPGSQLIPWMYGAPLRPFHLLYIILFWGVVAFQWLQRRNPRWQLSAGGFGQPNLIDTFGSWFDRQSASFKLAYWLVVIIAAIVIYRIM